MMFLALKNIPQIFSIPSGKARELVGLEEPQIGNKFIKANEVSPVRAAVPCSSSLVTQLISPPYRIQHAFVCLFLKFLADTCPFLGPLVPLY